MVLQCIFHHTIECHPLRKKVTPKNVLTKKSRSDSYKCSNLQPHTIVLPVSLHRCDIYYYVCSNQCIPLQEFFRILQTFQKKCFSTSVKRLITKRWKDVYHISRDFLREISREYAWSSRELRWHWGVKVENIHPVDRSDTKTMKTLKWRSLRLWFWSECFRIIRQF